MKTSGIFETKNRLSELCEQVALSGEPLVITRHGKPLVRILPIEDSVPHESVWDTVKESRALYGALDDGLEIPDRDSKVGRPDPLGPDLLGDDA